MKQVLGLLQKKDVDLLFDKYSIFIGDRDVVPMEVADELFNMDCRKVLKQGDWNAWCSRVNPPIRYLTKTRFGQVVSEYNINLFNKLLAEQE